MTATETIRVMTYNLKYADNDPPHSWPGRKELVKEIIVNEAPDLIGTQEGLFPQLEDLAELLPGYRWVGLGREGGSQGEYMAILYKHERLRVLEYGHFWLSDSPSLIGSCTWGNICPRMVTWVRFLDLKTKQHFYHFNTHLDNHSELARIEGAKLLAQRALELDSAMPIVVTGDFNENQQSEAYRILAGEGPFSDTWYLSARRINEELGTFNDFSDPSGGNERIDWILVRGNTEVRTAKIVGDRPGGQFPSDHYPIVVEMQLEVHL
ncbi:endonuclease/exonuclease/phosphatase family protein [Bacillus sp. FJAT-27245]|uniref:endonuclease/exonuclease/phosphatase family protein n=1 Tax=Bacillus sp. FJAT-27245 TaxID=1684144 RepID=UPI0006A7DA6C|nr:endonuclease/exonuclease/phosphatase family protein [Bacillus sp. FJAT-27245]